MTTPLTITLSLEPLTVAIQQAAATTYPITLQHYFPILYSGVRLSTGEIVQHSGTDAIGVITATIVNERHHLVFNFLVGGADGIIVALPVALVCFGLLVIRRAMIAAGGGSGGGRW